MGAQTWEDVKRFFDTSAGAALVASAFTATAMIAGACAMWPAEVLSCVGL